MNMVTGSLLLATHVLCRPAEKQKGKEEGRRKEGGGGRKEGGGGRCEWREKISRE